jgi:uncharacterized membrane protein YesL
MERKNLQGMLVDAYINFIPLIVLNVIWFLLSLLLVTIPPALFGLHYAVNRLVHQRDADWRVLLEGVRLHFWRSWRWGLANLIVLPLLAVNIFFYSFEETLWAVPARLITIGLLVTWMCIQIYVIPLVMEQRDQRLRVAFRNAFVICLKRPLYTLGYLLLFAIIIAFSVIVGPSWVFITVSLCAYIANRATINSIARLTAQQP